MNYQLEFNESSLFVVKEGEYIACGSEIKGLFIPWRFLLQQKDKSTCVK